MIVLVTGGRPNTMDTRGNIFAYLSAFHRTTPIDILIHGDADGTDKACGAWAKANGVQRAICPADWDYYDRDIAGPRRNRLMLLLKPDVCIVFPGGRGTENMMKQSERAGVRIMRTWQA